MQSDWQIDAPIYRQLRERIVGLILDGELTTGDALPSVRQVSADYRINPLTVSKAYEGMVEENIVEKRRGLGMFINEGAADRLRSKMREQFLAEEWPRLAKRINQLGLRAEDLLNAPLASSTIQQSKQGA